MVKEIDGEMLRSVTSELGRIRPADFFCRHFGKGGQSDDQNQMDGRCALNHV